MLSQKHFSCAEANLGAGADSLPLLVMAISETLLPWPAYAKNYSGFAEAPQSKTVQGHFNPGVQAAAAEVSGMTAFIIRKKLLSIWLLYMCRQMSCACLTEAVLIALLLLYTKFGASVYTD